MLNNIIPDIINRKNLAILGGGGVGKTYLVNQIIEILKDNLKIAVTATTGLAATHINGHTIHRFSGIGGLSCIDDFKKIFYSKEWPHIVARVRNTDVIIIDEISMLRSDTMNFLDYTLKAVTTKRNLPFGGVQIIVVGDFLQLPPVVKRSEYFTKPWAFQSECWYSSQFKIYYLTKVKRQNDKEFIDALNKIRLGQVDDTTNKFFKDREGVTLETLNTDPVKLMGTNRNVKKFNDAKMETLTTKNHTYGAKVTYREKKDWYAIKQETNALDVLDLKEGCQVMITSNDKDDQWVNGSMGVFKTISPPDPYGESLMERIYPTMKIELNKGHGVYVPMKKWTLYDDIPIRELEEIRILEMNMMFSEAEKIKKPYEEAKYIQFPIKPAYAITVHKAQGMTLDQVDFECSDMFMSGQVYVALSRVKALNGLKITNWWPGAVRANKAALEFYNSLLS